MTLKLHFEETNLFWSTTELEEIVNINYYILILILVLPILNIICVFTQACIYVYWSYLFCCGNVIVNIYIFPWHPIKSVTCLTVMDIISTVILLVRTQTHGPNLFSMENGIYNLPLSLGGRLVSNPSQCPPTSWNKLDLYIPKTKPRLWVWRKIWKN